MSFGLHDFGHFRRLRQRKAVAHRLHIGGPRLAPAVPADLFHAVVEFDAVAIRIEHIDRPVAAGKVTAQPADIHLTFGEIVVSAHDFLERADLERDLVDEHAPFS